MMSRCCPSHGQIPPGPWWSIHLLPRAAVPQCHWGRWTETLGDSHQPGSCMPSQQAVGTSRGVSLSCPCPTSRRGRGRAGRSRGAQHPGRWGGTGWVKVFPTNWIFSAGSSWIRRNTHVGLLPTSQSRPLQGQVCSCCGSDESGVLPTACVLLVANAEAVYSFVYLKKDHFGVLFCF